MKAKLPKRFRDLEPKVLDHWSYSAYSQLNRCALAFYWRYIMGAKEEIKEVPPAMQRGIDLHKAQEAYLKRETNKIPYALRHFEAHLKQVRKLKPEVEQWWGVDKRWRPVKWKSWLVAKLDFTLLPTKKNDYTLFAQDLKTGREYDDHDMQGDVYAALGVAIYPKTKWVETEFWYPDLGYSTQIRRPASYYVKRQEFWRKQGQKVCAPHPASHYVPSPSFQNCKWCFLRTDRGGMCNAYKSLGRNI